MIKRLITSIVVLILASPADAQQVGLKRTPLQTVDFPDKYSTVSVIAELAPGVSAGHHNHPGAETGYVLEGEYDLMIDGMAVQHLQAGNSWQIAAGIPHDLKNTGTQPLKILVVYIVEKGKPLASPVP
jgi:quercetin dioxygenase-like cupin family protein